MISLSIAIMVIMLTVWFQSQLVNSARNERLFFNSLRLSWDNLQSNNSQNHRYVITFESDQVNFFDVNDRQMISQLKYPPNLHVYNFQELKISPNGFMSPKTIRWYDNQNNLKYTQTIQLGWGGYNLQKN